MSFWHLVVAVFDDALLYLVAKSLAISCIPIYRGNWYLSVLDHSHS